VLILNQRIKTVFLFASAIGLSLFAWSGATWHVGLSLLAPLIWYFSRSRLSAFGIMASYHATASHALPTGITTYFGSPFVGGVALWLIAAFVVGSVWGVCWHSSSRVRFCTLPLGLFVTAVPPVGLIGWCHPITGAGILFPGFGVYGLLIGVLGVMGLTRLSAVKLVWVTVFVGLWAYAVDRPVGAPDGWKSLQTRSGAYQDDLLTGNSWNRHRELSVAMLEKLPARVVISPESSGGRWHGMADQFWRDFSSNYPEAAFLVGAEYSTSGEARTDNVLLCAKNGDISVLYRQRMPVPLTMWNPLKADGVNAHWFNGAVHELAGKKVGFLICYEQLLPWVVAQSLVGGAEVLAGSANDWWAAGGNIPDIQDATMHAWARLFGAQMVTSFNL